MLNNLIKYYSFLSLWGIQVLMIILYGTLNADVSTNFTIPLRIFISFFAIFLFFKYIKLIKMRYELAPIFIFFFMIILRCLYDHNRIDIVMGTSGLDYLLKWVSIIVIPVLPFLIAFNDSNINNIKKGFKYIIYLFIILFFVFYGQYLTYDYRLLHYSAQVSLDYMINPQILAYFALFSISIFFTDLYLKKSFSIINVLFLIASVYILVYSGSRGAFISFVVLVFFLTLKLNRSVFIFIITAFTTIVMLNYFEIFNKLNFSLFDRFTVLIENYNKSNFQELGTSRYKIWQNAIGQFSESPFFGSGIEEHVSRYVAHNSFIEAFTSTGIFGGILFIGIILKSLKNAFFLINIKSEASFISFLFLTTLITSLFSSSIFNPQIWFCIFLLITFKHNEINRRYRV